MDTIMNDIASFLSVGDVTLAEQASYQSTFAGDVVRAKVDEHRPHTGEAIAFKYTTIVSSFVVLKFHQSKRHPTADQGGHKAAQA